MVRRILTVMLLAVTVAAAANAGCDWVWHEYTETQNGYWEHVCTPDYDVEMTSAPGWTLYPNGTTVWISTEFVDGLPVPTSWYAVENSGAPSCCTKGPYTVANGVLTRGECDYTVTVSHEQFYGDGSSINRYVQYCNNNHAVVFCGRGLTCPSMGPCAADDNFGHVLTCPF